MKVRCELGFEIERSMPPNPKAIREPTVWEIRYTYRTYERWGAEGPPVECIHRETSQVLASSYKEARKAFRNWFRQNVSMPALDRYLKTEDYAGVVKGRLRFTAVPVKL